MISIRSAALAFVSAVTLVAGAVAPASAHADPTPPAVAAKAKASLPDAKDDKRRVCVQGNVTGTIIPQRECHTRSDWIALTGIDPLVKKH